MKLYKVEVPIYHVVHEYVGSAEYKSHTGWIHESSIMSHKIELFEEDRPFIYVNNVMDCLTRHHDRYGYMKSLKFSPIMEWLVMQPGLHSFVPYKTPSRRPYDNNMQFIFIYFTDSSLARWLQLTIDTHQAMRIRNEIS